MNTCIGFFWHVARQCSGHQRLSTVTATCKLKRLKEQPSTDDLWNAAPAGGHVLDVAHIRSLPEGARRYIRHSVTDGAPLASAVRLRMHGEIKLKVWCPFSAEQVIRWDRGMIWRAAVKMYGLTIRGGDSYLDGEGAMRWKLFGILPLVNASGADITRSAAGRVNIESIWLPSVLCSNDVTWTASEESNLHVRFTAHDEIAEIDYLIDAQGGLKSVSMPRWGNPQGAEFHYANCGGWVEEEGTFSGYTIPTRMRIGWHFGTDKFETEGEFFRVTIDEAVYR
jgi:hypothetical protein